jgi:hypothetical protein
MDKAHIKTYILSLSLLTLNKIIYQIVLLNTNIGPKLPRILIGRFNNMLLCLVICCSLGFRRTCVIVVKPITWVFLQHKNIKATPAKYWQTVITNKAKYVPNATTNREYIAIILIRCNGIRHQDKGFRVSAYKRLRFFCV